MTNLRTAAQQALEALEEWHGAYPHRVEEDDIEVAEALRAALAAPVQEPCTYKCETWPECECAKPWQSAPPQRPAEPVQEPFCYVYEYDGPYGLHREFYPREYNGMKPTRTVPLYAAPPQRKPLTEQEIWDAVQHGVVGGIGLPSKAIAVARAVEQAHGIKE